jgi:MFS family permease
MVGLNTFFHSDLLYHPKKKLTRLILAGAARNASISFLAYFSAVYIYQLFYGLGKSSRESIYYVLIFYLILNITKQIVYSISEDLSQKIGFQNSIRLSLIPFVLLIAFMIFSGTNPYLVLFAGAFWGIHAGFYWWGYHGYFIKSGDSQHFGAGIGEQDMIIALSGIIAPIIGAIVISQYGFNYIFILSFVFMLAAIILLANDKKIIQKHDVYYGDVIRLLLKHKSITLAYISGGIEGTFYLIGWGLFLYFFFGNVLGLGFVVSVSLFLSAIFSIFIGRHIDKSGERKVIAVGTPLFSLSWVLRAFVSAPFMFVLADSFRFFSDKMVALPLMKISYKKGRDDYIAKAILFREIALGIGSIAALSLIFVFVQMDKDFVFQFFVVALISLFPLIAIVKKRI